MVVIECFLCQKMSNRAEKRFQFVEKCVKIISKMRLLGGRVAVFAEKIKIYKKLKEKKGTSMLLIVCLFLILCVMGINVLNAANANVMNTAEELEKEQTMLYVSSVYEIVNKMIEDGEFSDAAGNLPGGGLTSTSLGSLKDGSGKDITVKVEFQTGSTPIVVKTTITCVGSTEPKDYTIEGTYEKDNSNYGHYRRRSCRGLKE